MNEIVRAFFRRSVEEFRFLCDEFGFSGPVKRSDGGIYRVSYQGKTSAVEIGLEWREQYVYVELFRLLNGKIKENPIIITPESELTVINLESLKALKSPKMKLAPEYSNNPLTVESVDHVLTLYDRSLRELGRNVLTGDFRVFAEIEKVVKARLSSYPVTHDRKEKIKGSALTKKHLPAKKLEDLVSEMVNRGILFEDAVAEFEKYFVLSVLKKTNGNLSKTSEVLRIHRNTLSKRIDKYFQSRMIGARHRHQTPARAKAATARSKA